MPLCSSAPPLIISLHFKKLNKNLKKNKSTYWSPIIKASSPIRVTICLNLQWSFGVEKAMMQCPLNYFRTHFAAVQVQLAVVGKCICWHKWLTGKDFKAFLKYCIVRHIPHVDFLKHHSKGLHLTWTTWNPKQKEKRILRTWTRWIKSKVYVF